MLKIQCQRSRGPKFRKGRIAKCLLQSVVLSLLLLPWSANQTIAQEDEKLESGYRLPFTNSQKGRDLFVGKGCVVCHSINGTGGAVGPSLDADPEHLTVDPFDFAARMWRGAPVMIILQEMELGYQIEFSGQELAHIVHFLYDTKAQQDFSEQDIPELIRDWMVDETYDELNVDDWAQ